MAKGTSGGGLSLRTKDATEGGGIDGSTATVTEIGFVDEFTYGGRHKDKPQAALRVVYEIDGMEKPWDQHYSVGPSEKYEVVADGDGIKALGKASGINRKSSAHAFFAALEEAAGTAGVDIDELLPELDEGGNSVRPLEGRRVRLGNTKFTTVGGDVKDLPVIVGFADDAQPARRNGKANGRTTTATSTKRGLSPDIEGQTETAVLALLEDESTIKKSNLANAVYQANRKDPNAKAMMELAFKDTWVFGEERPWDSDRKKGTIKARD